MNLVEDPSKSSSVCALMRSSSGDRPRTTSSAFLPLSPVSAARPMARAFRTSPGLSAVNPTLPGFIHLFNVLEACAYLNCNRIAELQRIRKNFKRGEEIGGLREVRPAHSNRSCNLSQPAPYGTPRTGAAQVTTPLVARRVRSCAQLAPAA